MEPRLPEESVSQKIGHEAKHTFSSRHPTCWRRTELAGDSDVGLDFLVQVVTNASYDRLFHVQLKGCAQKKEDGSCARLNKEKTHYAQQLDISTLNYYIRIDRPVMLVFVDLTQHKSPRQCNAYYVWIDNEIKSLRGKKPNLDHLGKKSHTFHIPVSNVLDEATDVLPYLKTVHDKSLALQGLFDRVAEHAPEPVPTIEALGRRVSDPTVLASVLHETDSPWISAPPDTNAWHLNRAANYVRTNIIKLAQEELDTVTPNLEKLSPHEKAEYYYLSSHISLYLGDRQAAIENARTAQDTYPDADKYRLSYLEQLADANWTDKEFLAKTLAAIELETKIEYVRLRSIILALLGDPRATEELKTYTPKDVCIARCLASFLLGDYGETTSLCEEFLAHLSLTSSQKTTLHVLKARALFWLGFSACEVTGPIPFAGLPGMNEDVLRTCWETVLDVWKDAEGLNYPTDLAYIADASAVLGVYFGEISKIYAQIRTFAGLHPRMAEMQEILLAVASSLEDYDTAEVQYGRVKKTPQMLVTQICNEYRQSHLRNVVELTLQHIDTLLPVAPRDLDVVLLAAAGCADTLGMSIERDTFLGKAREMKYGDILLALFSFHTTITYNALARDDAVRKLYTHFDDGCRHSQLLAQLFHHLDSRQETDATRLVDVADAICGQRQLMRDEILKLCEALSALRRWDDMIAVLESASKRFPHDPRILSAMAMALDHQGNTPAALRILSDVSSQIDDAYVLEMYANICARCGLTNRAQEIVLRLLETAEDRERKLHCYRLLFTLEMRRDHTSPRLKEYCKKYGELADPQNESDEGLHLQLMLITRLSGNTHSDEDENAEFQRRVESFTQKFPESKYLRAVRCPADAPAETLLERMKEVSGLTDSALRRYERAETLLRSGKVPLPFALRPQHLLNVCDVLHLWQLSKASTIDQRQYHLILEAGKYSYGATAELKKKTPLVDEISLLVLNDLGILPHLFTVFDQVAIPRSTISRLQNWSQHFISTFSPIAEAITTELKNHIGKIRQPSAGTASLTDITWTELEEYRQIVTSNRDMVLFSDDAMVRCYVYGDDYKARSVTTLDLIELVREKGILSELRASQKILTLCKWHVGGICVKWTDILRVISLDIGPDEEVDQVLAKLRVNDAFQSAIDYIWVFDKPYEKALEDIASFVSFMLVGESGLKVGDTVIIAIWHFWYSKVCLKPNGERSKMAYFARAFWLIARGVVDRLRDNEGAYPAISARAWSIYRSIVQHAFADEMSEELEDESLRSVAQFAVRTRVDLRDHVSSFLRAGLIEGTTDYGFFDHEYVEAAIQRDMKK